MSLVRRFYTLYSKPQKLWNVTSITPAKQFKMITPLRTFTNLKPAASCFVINKKQETNQQNYSNKFVKIPQSQIRSFHQQPIEKPTIKKTEQNIDQQAKDADPIETETMINDLMTIVKFVCRFFACIGFGLIFETILGGSIEKYGKFGTFCIVNLFFWILIFVL